MGPQCQFCLLELIAEPAVEAYSEGMRADASTAPMKLDAVAVPAAQGGTPTPDELQKQSSNTDTNVGQEAGQLEADGEGDVEAGMIDGETDVDVDLKAIG